MEQQTWWLGEESGQAGCNPRTCLLLWRLVCTLFSPLVLLIFHSCSYMGVPYSGEDMTSHLQVCILMDVQLKHACILETFSHSCTRSSLLAVHHCAQ